MPSEWFSSPQKADRLVRLCGVVDVDVMSKSTVIIFGSGSGGTSLVSIFASVGVGKIDIFDDGIFELPNVATTQINMRCVGRRKIDVACEDAVAVNPDVAITGYLARDHDVDPATMSRLIPSASLILNLTDDVGAAVRLNLLGLHHSRDIIHGATHAGNRSFEVIGTLGAGYVHHTCYRCVARTRCDAFEAGEIAVSETFPTFRPFSDERNAKIALFSIGLLHFRAGSTLPIAAWGEALVRNPCWVGRMMPDVFTRQGALFHDSPADLQFGMRPYQDPLPPGWTCPACRNHGA